MMAVFPPFVAFGVEFMGGNLDNTSSGSLSLFTLRLDKLEARSGA